jgi:hypothetical protein
MFGMSKERHILRGPNCLIVNGLVCVFLIKKE